MTAPMVLDGAMNGIAFLAYVEQVLVPTLAPGGVDLPFIRSTKLERETPSVSAAAFIANRPSATRSAAISVF